MPDSKLLSVSEALERFLEGMEPLSSEEVYLANAYGRVLVQNIDADMDLPPFSNSSMDGFAVRAIDVSGASDRNPVELNVVGDISAGKGDDVPVGKNQAVRIMTGGVLPEGADSVVPVELTNKPGALAEKKLEPFVEIHKDVSKGDFMGKSQETPQLAVGRNGKRGFGGGSPHYGFFLGISPGRIGGTSSRNKIEELSL